MMYPSKILNKIFCTIIFLFLGSINLNAADAGTIQAAYQKVKDARQNLIAIRDIGKQAQAIVSKATPQQKTAVLTYSTKINSNYSEASKTFNKLNQDYKNLSKADLSKINILVTNIDAYVAEISNFLQDTNTNFTQIQNLTGQQPGGVPGQLPGGIPGQPPSGIPGQQPGGTPGQPSGGTTGQPSGGTTGTPGQQPGGILVQQLGGMFVPQAPGGQPGGQPGQQPGGTAGQPSGGTTGTPDQQSGGATGGTSGVITSQPSGGTTGTPGQQPGGATTGQPGQQPGGTAGQPSGGTSGVIIKQPDTPKPVPYIFKGEFFKQKLTKVLENIQTTAPSQKIQAFIDLVTWSSGKTIEVADRANFVNGLYTLYGRVTASGTSDDKSKLYQLLINVKDNDQLVGPMYKDYLQNYLINPLAAAGITLPPVEALVATDSSYNVLEKLENLFEANASNEPLLKSLEVIVDWAITNNKAFGYSEKATFIQMLKDIKAKLNAEGDAAKIARFQTVLTKVKPVTNLVGGRESEIDSIMATAVMPTPIMVAPAPIAPAPTPEPTPTVAPAPTPETPTTGAAPTPPPTRGGATTGAPTGRGATGTPAGGRDTGSTGGAPAGGRGGAASGGGSRR